MYFCRNKRDVPDTTLPDTGFNWIVASLNIRVRE